MKTWSRGNSTDRRIINARPARIYDVRAQAQSDSGQAPEKKLVPEHTRIPFRRPWLLIRADETRRFEFTLSQRSCALYSEISGWNSGSVFEKVRIYRIDCMILPPSVWSRASIDSVVSRRDCRRFVGDLQGDSRTHSAQGRPGLARGACPCGWGWDVWENVGRMEEDNGRLRNEEGNTLNWKAREAQDTKPHRRFRHTVL